MAILPNKVQDQQKLRKLLTSSSSQRITPNEEKKTKDTSEKERSISVESDSDEGSDSQDSNILNSYGNKSFSNPPSVKGKVFKVASILPKKTVVNESNLNEIVVNNDITIKGMKERKFLDLNRWYCISRP